MVRLRNRLEKCIHISRSAINIFTISDPTVNSASPWSCNLSCNELVGHLLNLNYRNRLYNITKRAFQLREKVPSASISQMMFQSLDLLPVCC